MRTCFFTGSTKAACSVEGNKEVDHVDAPSVTSTRTDPKPPVASPTTASTSSLTSWGTVTKCQEPSRHRHRVAANVHRVAAGTGAGCASIP